MPEPTWVPKNTLVRHTLRDIQARQEQQQQQQHQAALAAAAEAAAQQLVHEQSREGQRKSPASPGTATEFVSSMTAGVTEAGQIEARKREEELLRWQAGKAAAGKGGRGGKQTSLFSM